MGLDIVAYRALQGATCADGIDCDEHFIPYGGYFNRLGSLEAGCYEHGASIHFGAGSYSGYHRWRSELSLLALGSSPSQVWAHPERFADRPFFELVNFSDCEGTIGPEVSAKLAKDFAAWDERAIAAWGRESSAYATYARFRRAFEWAADGGAVDFR